MLMSLIPWWKQLIYMTTRFGCRMVRTSLSVKQRVSLFKIDYLLLVNHNRLYLLKFPFGIWNYFKPGLSWVAEWQEIFARVNFTTDYSASSRKKKNRKWPCNTPTWQLRLSSLWWTIFLRGQSKLHNGRAVHTDADIFTFISYISGLVE